MTKAAPRCSALPLTKLCSRRVRGAHPRGACDGAEGIRRAAAPRAPKWLSVNRLCLVKEYLAAPWREVCQQLGGDFARLLARRARFGAQNKAWFHP